MFSIQIIIYFIGLMLIILTVLPLLKLDVWWIRIGDFPRLQIAFLCGLVSAVFLVLGYPLGWFEITFLCLLAVCTLYQFYCILPYTFVYPKQVEDAVSPQSESTIKLLISNVLIDNEDPDKLLKLVENVNPDLVLLAEPDERWLKEVAELEKEYKYYVKYALDNAYGMALYSRLKLENPQLKFLVEDDIPSIHTGVRLTSGDLINLYCVHPRPPMPPENDRSTERDAELVMVGRMIKGTDTPTIIAGDLNDVAWSRTTTLFQKISNMLDPRIGRGLFSSFHTGHWFIRFPLDHVFHTNHFRLADIKRLSSIGSDHFPIYVALSYEQTAEYSQEEPKADANEEKESIEMIEDAKAKVKSKK